MARSGSKEERTLARKLKRAGLSNAQIAKALDRNRKTIAIWLAESTYQGRRCRDCGTPLRPTGSNRAGSNKRPTVRCIKCHLAHREETKYWTKSRLLTAAREWKRRYGQWPKTRDWWHARTLDGYRYPSYSTALERKGKNKMGWKYWSDFLISAGARHEVNANGNPRILNPPAKNAQKRKEQQRAALQLALRNQEQDDE